MEFGFGEFTLDLRQRCLFTRGRGIPLAPKAFDLLRLLIECRPRVLGKDEIHGRLWPDTFVTENAVATVVADLRRVLGDDVRQPRYIRTSYRYGYAFVADVVVPHEERDGDGRQSSESNWRLIVDHHEISLEEGDNILGREGSGVVVLASPTVSRRHARVSIVGDVAVCEDLGSLNGTWVGPARLAGPTRVEDGAELRLGSVVAVIRCGRATRSTRPFVSIDG